MSKPDPFGHRYDPVPTPPEHWGSGNARTDAGLRPKRRGNRSAIMLSLSMLATAVIIGFVTGLFIGGC